MDTEKKPTPRWFFYFLFFAAGSFAGILSTWAIVAPGVDQLAEKAGTGGTQKVTLLYDPQANQTLATEGKLATLYSGNSAIPYTGNPRWMIAGKVTPLVNGDSNGVMYYYFDLQTKIYEGPFLPEVPKRRD